MYRICSEILDITQTTHGTNESFQKCYEPGNKVFPGHCPFSKDVEADDGDKEFETHCKVPTSQLFVVDGVHEATSSFIPTYWNCFNSFVKFGVDI